MSTAHLSNHHGVAYPSTLPLTQGGILHHTKLVPKVYKLCFRQKLGENVSYLLVRGYVLELHCSLLHHVLDEVVFDLQIK